MINLNDDYFITADSYCFTLKRRGSGKNKDGEPIQTETNVGCYSSVSNAIKGAIRDTKLRAVKEKTYTLAEWLVKIQDINESFEEILKRALKED